MPSGARFVAQAGTPGCVGTLVDYIVAPEGGCCQERTAAEPETTAPVLSVPEAGEDQAGGPGVIIESSGHRRNRSRRARRDRGQGRTDGIAAGSIAVFQQVWSKVLA
jgi:hypothetical protein